MKAGNGFQEKRSTTEINPNQILKQQHPDQHQAATLPEASVLSTPKPRENYTNPPPKKKKKNTEDKVLTLFTAYTLNPDP